MKYGEPNIEIFLFDESVIPITAISNIESNLDMPGDIDIGGLDPED